MKMFRELTKYEQQKIANELSSFLLPFFANETYYNESDLQKDFARFQTMNVYKQVVEKFMRENKVEVSFLLKTKRWKVCRVCYKPFLATDTGNKQQLCRYNTYKKYTTSGRQLNVHNRSTCEMEGRRRSSKRWYTFKEVC